MVKKKTNSSKTDNRTKKIKKVAKKQIKTKKKRKNSGVKKIVRRNKIAKKRNLKRKKHVSRKHGFFVSFFDGSRDWMKGGMKRVRKEQRHCLRFKKYKGKQSFCFVKALLSEYPWRTMLGFLVVVVIGLSVLTASFQNSQWGNYLGINLQTSLISQLSSRISSIRGQISERQKCVQDKYWTEPEDDVCNYWAYKQVNNNCAKFNVSIERGAMGKKVCCNPLESVVYSGKDKNVTACPAATMFFDRKKMHNTTLVANRDGCGLGVCQFYPAEGYLVKFDVQGNVDMGGEGQPLIVKPCQVKREVGACDRDCGGGKRIVTGQDMYCNHFKMTELCNIEPCFTETIAN